jgi:hypothetical protein
VTLSRGWRRRWRLIMAGERKGAWVGPLDSCPWTGHDTSSLHNQPHTSTRTPVAQAAIPTHPAAAFCSPPSQPHPMHAPPPSASTQVPSDATVALAMLDDAAAERLAVQVSPSTWARDMGPLTAGGTGEQGHRAGGECTSGGGGGGCGASIAQG